MVNFTLNFGTRLTGAHSSEDREGGSCGAGVCDHCDKTIVATIISQFSKTSSISVLRRSSAFQRHVIRSGARECRTLRNSSEDGTDGVRVCELRRREKRRYIQCFFCVLVSSCYVRTSLKSCSDR